MLDFNFIKKIISKKNKYNFDFNKIFMSNKNNKIVNEKTLKKILSSINGGLPLIKNSDESQKELSEIAFEILNKNFDNKKYDFISWCEKYRKIPGKGNWNIKETPYLKEIIHCLSENSEFKHVVLLKPAQWGATELLINWMGYTIAEDPAAMIVVYPTENMLNIVMSKRFKQLREEDIVKKNIVSNTKNSIDIRGNKGYIIGVSGNVETGLVSTPANRIGVDEVDQLKQKMADGGSPIELIKNRTIAYEKSKIFFTGTPKKDSTSHLKKLFLSGDQREQYFPCQECNNFQILKWENFIYKDGNNSLLDEPFFRCIECNNKIYEMHVKKNKHLCKWIPSSESKSETASFRGNAFIGFQSWKLIRDRWINIQKYNNKNELMVFVNDVLVEFWKEENYSLALKELLKKRINYSQGNFIPKEAAILTMGVDIQKDRIEAEIVIWCNKFISYSYQYVIFRGDTSDINSSCWKNLKNLISGYYAIKDENRTWITKKRTLEEESKGIYIRTDGKEIFLNMVLIDCGYNTDIVYKFCSEFKTGLVLPAMGQYFKDPNIRLKRNDIKRKEEYKNIILNNLIRIDLNDDSLKREVFNMLNTENALFDKITFEKLKYGTCFFPVDYEEHYFDMFTAERLETRINRDGYEEEFWIKDSGKNNEAIDCRKMALAAVYLLAEDWLINNDLDINDKNLFLKWCSIKNNQEYTDEISIEEAYNEEYR